MTVKADGRGRPRFRAAAAGALAAALLAGGRADAHPEFSAAGTNRYVTAAVFDGRVDVTDALLGGALVSGEDRRRLDADRDGTVSESERRAGEERLRAAGPDLAVELDGRPIAAPLEVGIDLGDDARVGAAALVIERRQSFTAAWPPGEHRLRIALARDPARLLETELGVVLGPGLALHSPDRTTFKGPRTSALQDRSATFVFSSTTPPPRRPPVLVLVLVLVAVLVLVSVFVVRRRRRSPP